MNDEELRSFFPYFSEEEIEEGYKAIEKIAEMCEDFSLQKSLHIPNLLWRELKNYPRSYKEYFSLMPTLEKFYNSAYKSDRYLVDAIIDGIHNHPTLQTPEGYAALEDNLLKSIKQDGVLIISIFSVTLMNAGPQELL